MAITLEPGTQVNSAMGKQNEWLLPPLEKNGESCITVGPVTSTAGILAYGLYLAPLYLRT